MTELLQIRFRVKLIKYLSLSISIILLVTILTNICIQTLPMHNKITDSDSNDIADSPLQEYNFSIRQSTFYGVDNDLLPYTIIAEKVVKNTSNQYILDIVDITYILSDGKVVMQAHSAVMDAIKKSIVLNNDVNIIYNNVVLYSQKVTVGLDTKDIKSDDNVEVTFNKLKIRANKFYTNNIGKVIKFEGNVNLNFEL